MHEYASNCLQFHKISFLSLNNYIVNTSLNRSQINEVNETSKTENDQVSKL